MKTKSSLDYELTIILKCGLSEEREKEILKELKSFIVENGGEVLFEEKMGLRELAYPIAKNLAGVYYYFIFKLSPSLIANFDKEIKFLPEVLRHLIVRTLRLPKEQPLSGSQEGKTAKREEEKGREEVDKEDKGLLGEEQKLKLEGKLQEMLKE